MDAEGLKAEFSAFLAERQESVYNRVHTRRFLLTFSQLARHLTPSGKILELGGLSILSEFLQKCGYDVREYTQDVRYPLNDIPSETFNLVFGMEIIEHLKDRDPRPGYAIAEVGSFNFSGVKTAFSEAYRVLAHGGSFVITTPNAVSADAIGRLFLGKQSTIYQPHVREYAPEDLVGFAAEAGFTVEQLITFDSWNPLPGIDRERILALLKSHGFSTDNRGDNIFAVFMK